MAKVLPALALYEPGDPILPVVSDGNTYKVVAVFTPDSQNHDLVLVHADSLTQNPVYSLEKSKNFQKPNAVTFTVGQQLKIAGDPNSFLYTVIYVDQNGDAVCQFDLIGDGQHLDVTYLRESQALTGQLQDVTGTQSPPAVPPMT